MVSARRKARTESGVQARINLKPPFLRGFYLLLKFNFNKKLKAVIPSDLPELESWGQAVWQTKRRNLCRAPRCLRLSRRYERL